MLVARAGNSGVRLPFALIAVAVKALWFARCTYRSVVSMIVERVERHFLVPALGLWSGAAGFIVIVPDSVRSCFIGEFGSGSGGVAVRLIDCLVVPKGQK